MCEEMEKIYGEKVRISMNIIKKAYLPIGLMRLFNYLF